MKESNLKRNAWAEALANKTREHDAIQTEVDKLLARIDSKTDSAVKKNLIDELKILQDKQSDYSINMFNKPTRNPHRSDLWGFSYPFKKLINMITLKILWY
jgi:hypothetical protein